MATQEELVPEQVLPEPEVEQKVRPVGYLRRSGIDTLIAGIIAVLAAVSRIWNIAGYPRWFTDEGVYVSQAWAVQYEHVLAPYTYWYDHPPGGWIQMALWSVLTGAQHRHKADSVLAGREYMVVMAVATAVLMYVLARRLGFRRPFAAAASLLWILSPLALTFSRYVLLDNIAIPWMLAAFVLALSPTRKIIAAFGSGLCVSIAGLSKETILPITIAVLFVFWRHYRQSPNRWYCCVAILGGMVIWLAYPLYALFKLELWPGKGHVSLWQGQIEFQLLSRTTSGNMLDPHSAARLLISNAWLGLDKWLPLAGTAAILPALFVRRLQGIALALAIQVAIMFKGGYLPYPYIIAMLPFMTMLLAGVADAMWPRGTWRQKGLVRRVLASAGILVVLAAGAGFTMRTEPSWRQGLQTSLTADSTAVQRQTVDWVAKHLPQDARLVTEGELWLDIRNRGFNNPEVIWTYKVDTDPAVRAKYGSVAGLDYLVVDATTLQAGQAVYPTLLLAAKHAKVLASFGTGQNQVLVLKVTHRS